MSDGDLRTSRLGRAYELAKLAANVSLDVASGKATRLLGARDDKERASALDELLGDKVAEETFRVLSSLKGLALKAGQMVATSADLVPEEYRPAVRRVLGRLYDRATPLPFETVKRSVEQDLGRAIDEVFLAFEPEPFAAASIGQVHRATLRSGEPVAVKVQYPEVAAAIENDLANLGLVKRALAGLLRADVDRTFEDLRARVLEECDYALEARRLELFRKLWAGDPELRIPRVHLELSAKRTLVMELASGLRLAEMKDRSPEERSRAGAALYRFNYTAILRDGLIYADPHPGNFLFRPEEGFVWVLDFGCIQELEPDFVALTRRMHTAALEGQPDVVMSLFDEALEANPTAEETKLLDSFLIDYVYRPFAKDAEFEFTDAYVREVIDWTIAGQKLALKNVVGRGNREPRRKGVVWLNRILVGLNNVLAALSSRANFHRLHRGILALARNEDAPASEAHRGADV
jgi:predicted unusual protein kinase regulating ubiquinone biosynthesis (AarF/ABC1/UbiB family)